MSSDELIFVLQCFLLFSSVPNRIYRPCPAVVLFSANLRFPSVLPFLLRPFSSTRSRRISEFAVVFVLLGPSHRRPAVAGKCFENRRKSVRIETMKLSVTIDRDEDGVWVVECPSIPGCVSQGKTKEQAVKNIEEVIALCLEVRAEGGLPLTIETRQVKVLVRSLCRTDF